VPERNSWSHPWRCTHRLIAQRGACRRELPCALAQLHIQPLGRSTANTNVTGLKTASENEDGTPLIPKSEVDICVRVQDWSHDRRFVVSRGSEGDVCLVRSGAIMNRWYPNTFPTAFFGVSKRFERAPASLLAIVDLPLPACVDYGVE